MATGQLRFRTSHIEELPTAQSRKAPGFAYIAVSGPQDDPAKNWGTTNSKRARTSLGGQTEQQNTARQQREIERKIRELNNDGSKSAQDVPIPKKDGAGNAAKVGRTTNTKKILGSGKTFTHYLDDEEAEIARTGRRDGDVEVSASVPRASKTPIARRRARAESSVSGSPAPSAADVLPASLPYSQQTSSTQVLDPVSDGRGEVNAVLALPTEAEIEALVSATPLTYNQARSAPPSSSAPPPRRFCESCGYWGRVKCMKCGASTCSMACQDDHVSSKCLKMYV